MRLRHAQEQGFSLVEVIIAVVMIGIVASGALWFFINGMQTSSNLQRQQSAVTLASSAMELSFVHDPRTSITEGVSGLVIGRSEADVTAAFDAVSGLSIDGLSDTYPMFDPDGGTPALPIVNETNYSGIDYTVYTLVGSCYRTTSTNGSDEACTTVSGYTEEPTATPVGKARLIRVLVVVTWEPIGEECEGLCSYDVSTLVDPSLDLEWNRIIEPVAVDDTFSFAVGAGATQLDVLDNDVLGSVPSYPVTILSGLPAGAGTLGTPSSSGVITYTPPAATKATWNSGIFTFTYRVRDARGETSQAVASIYLQPSAANDDFDVFMGVPQVIDITANDLGSPASINIVTPPSRGTLSISGTQVTYTPTSVGVDLFVYNYLDGSELRSPDATARVEVQAVQDSDVTVQIPYRSDAASTAGWVDITSNLRGSYGSAQVTVTGAPSGGALRINGVEYAGGTVTGTLVEFQPPAGVVGEWSFPFRLVLGGYSSDGATATMRVPVDANDDYPGNLRRNGTRTVIVGANDIPTTFGTGSGVTITPGATSHSRCGAFATPTAADRNAGQLRIVIGTNTRNNCWAEYTLTGGGVSETVRIYYNVVN